MPVVTAGTQSGPSHSTTVEATRGLSTAEVREHCRALRIGTRSLQRAIAEGLVEHPVTSGRGRGGGRRAWYPLAVSAQLDDLAAALRVTHRPIRVRQRLWWAGGPTGAPLAVRTALYVRVRADWDAAVQAFRSGLGLFGGDLTTSREVRDMEAALSTARGLRDLGVRVPRRPAARWNWAVGAAAALSGRVDLLVTPSGPTAAGEVIDLMVRRGLVGLGLAPAIGAGARLACELGPEFGRILTEVPLRVMPEADAEAGRADVWGWQAISAELDAEWLRQLPDLSGLRIGEDPLLTGLAVLAAFAVRHAMAVDTLPPQSAWPPGPAVRRRLDHLLAVPKGGTTETGLQEISDVS